jgi:hypothetical protein
MNTLNKLLPLGPVKLVATGFIMAQLLAGSAFMAPTATAADICSTSYGRLAKTGLVGGAAGGAVGALINGENRTKGAITGALIGAAGGAGYGYYREYQRKKDYNCDARQSNQPVYNNGYYNNDPYNNTYNNGYYQNTGAYQQDPYYAPQSNQSSGVLGGLLGGLF